MRAGRFTVRAAVILTSVAVIVGGLTATPPARASTPPAPAPASPFTSGVDDKCLDDFGNSASNGAVVDLYTCGFSVAQYWQPMSDGTMQINGLCLDVTADGTADGTPVELWQCNGGGNQQWRQTGGTLVNTQSGRCLDDPGFNITDGTQLVIWDCNGGSNQQWTPTGGIPITDPGGDMVISMDDGGVNQSAANQAINGDWPAAVHIGANPSLGDLMSANYNATSSFSSAVAPPTFSDGSLSVSGSTITLDVPAGDVAAAAGGLPQWLAALLAQTVAVASGAAAWALCTSLFNPANVFIQPLCWGVSGFVTALLSSYLSHVFLGGAPFNWTNCLIQALVTAIGGGALAYAAPSLIVLIGGKLPALFKAIVAALYRLGAWLGRYLSPVAIALGNFLGWVASGFVGLVRGAADLLGMAVETTTGSFVSGIAGKCLDAYAVTDYANDNNPVDIYTCNNMPSQTSWTWWSNDTLTVFGRCLDVVAQGTTNGSPVQLYDCNGGANQQWEQEGYELVNPASGRCLDDPAFGNDGTVLVIWDCNGGPNQQWTFR